jgi:3-oxocholest-4-en-26-oate---CoA ligase
VKEFNLADIWEAIADHIPERIALSLDGNHRTYGELEERANRLAHWLLDQGVQPGQHIGLYLQNSFEYLEGTLAAYKVRAVPINVNYRYVAEELRYLFNDADLVGVIYQPEYKEAVAEVEPDVPTLCWSLASGDDFEEAIASFSPVRNFSARSGDDHYILYTGGTTGMPKGVVWRQDDAFFACFGGGNPTLPEVTSIEELVERIAPEPMTFLLLAPLMHGAGGWTAIVNLLCGNRIVLWSGALRPDEVWKTIERERVNATSVVGDAIMRPLLDAWDVLESKPDTSQLHGMGSGGAPLSPVVRERFLTTFPTVFLTDGYGSSETGIQASRYFVGPTGSNSEAKFTGHQAVVLNEETREPVLPGSQTVGRVARTGRIPLAYYNDPEKSAATFVRWDDRRWSLTGDMATVAEDGSITLLGRGSICINTGGEKVYPEEVEAVLRTSYEVYDVLVVGAADELWGQRVVAVVEPTPGTSPTEEGLRTLARNSLSGYKVPKQVHFVDKVVRSPSGKADYRWAAEVAAKA